MDSHVKFKHTIALCDFCGKNFSCGATLEIHKNAVHKPKDKKLIDDSAKFFCELCGKAYCSKPVLRKHLRSHANEDSIVNRNMYEDPTEYKYMCTRHDNCKKYFKKAKYLKRHIQLFGDKVYPHFVHEQYKPVIPEGQILITDQEPKFWEVAEREEKAKKRLRKVQLQPVDVTYPATVPKTQTGTGAFACHVEGCGKSYDRKATLEKHLGSHSRQDSTVNRIMTEDPREYKFMCTRHPNCKKYFKKARYLRNHLYKFANIPYPENATSHYMPDIRPDQKFVTDQDSELWDILAEEERERRVQDKMRKVASSHQSQLPNQNNTQQQYHHHHQHHGERPMSISSLSSDEEDQ